MRRWEVAAAIAEEQVVAIVRAEEQEGAARAARALVEAGLRVVEVSLTTPGALEVVAELVASRPPYLVVGAGTVLDPVTARLAVLAGADFLVSPALDAEVLATAHRYGVATLPGASTPSEVVRALEAGADLVKLFPASSHPPAAVRDLLAALPQAPLVPTGGVSLDAAPDYVTAGAVALGLGSALTRGGPAEAVERVAALRARLREARADRERPGA